jgi:WD40 repeat protein/energy-coupling factor transporter ATP-binding protein EcfA2
MGRSGNELARNRRLMDEVRDPLLESDALGLPAAPYPGLRPFEKHEWAIFFGRETMTQDVITRVVDKHLVAIHGDSGCGKSSLVRAGVLPVLEMDHARFGGSWKTVLMRPEDSPIRNLAIALSLGDASRVDALKEIITHAEGAARPLAEMLCCNSENNVCILLDQFEELFEHARKHGTVEAEIITAFLTGLLRDKPAGLHAIITMRSDYLGQCAHYRGFAETVNDTQYLVPRMERPALWRAIREPATLYGGTVEAALVDRLIADAGTGQDQLPLIQHGLMLMWRKETGGDASREGWSLDATDYGGANSLATLLSRHAGDVLANVATNRDDARALELAFRALIDHNAEKQAIRRPQKFRDLCAVTGVKPARLLGLLRPFRAPEASFLRPYGDAPLTADSRIDISHEALIRNWDRVADANTGWLAKEADDGLRWTTLRLAAKAFAANAADLLSPATAEEAHRVFAPVNAAWAERYGGEWDAVQRLIAASRKAARRATNRWRLLIGVAVAVACVMAGLAWYAMAQTQRAREETARAAAEKARAEEQTARAEAALAVADLAARNAEQEQLRAEAALKDADEARRSAEESARQAKIDRERALRNETISFGALARIALDEGRPSDAMKLALAAWPRANDPARPMLKDVLDVTGRAVAATTIEVLSVDGRTTTAQMSPDGNVIAVGTRDGSMRLWDVRKKQWLGTLEGHSDDISSLAFSADSMTLASASDDRTVRLWSLAKNLQERSFKLADSTSSAANILLAFNQNGTKLLALDTTHGTNAAYVFTLDDWEHPKIFGNLSHLYRGDISPDGEHLALLSITSRVNIVDADTGSVLKLNDDYVGPVLIDVEYSRDGLWLAFVGDDRTVRILDSESLDPINATSPLGEINSISLSPDRRWIVMCGEQIAVANLESGKRIVSHGAPRDQLCRNANWASDGTTIMALSDTPMIWDISSIGSADALNLACARLGADTNLAGIEQQYGLSTLAPICGDNPPLPVDPAKLQ